MKFAEARTKSSDLIALLNSDEERLAAAHIENYVKLSERIKEKGFGMKEKQKMHYIRLLLLKLANESYTLTPLEYSNKLLAQKWTYYLDPMKYMSLYPNLFLTAKHSYITTHKTGFKVGK